MSNHHVSPPSPSTTSFPSCHTHQVQSSYLSIMTCPSCSNIMPSPAYPLIMSFTSCHTHHVLPIMSNHHVVHIMSYPSCHVHHVSPLSPSIMSSPSCRPHHVPPSCHIHHVQPSCPPIMSYPSCLTVIVVPIMSSGVFRSTSSYHVVSFMSTHHVFASGRLRYSEAEIIPQRCLHLEGSN